MATATTYRFACAKSDGLSVEPLGPREFMAFTWRGTKGSLLPSRKSNSDFRGRVALSLQPARRCHRPWSLYSYDRYPNMPCFEAVRLRILVAVLLVTAHAIGVRRFAFCSRIDDLSLGTQAR